MLYGLTLIWLISIWVWFTYSEAMLISGASKQISGILFIFDISFRIMILTIKTSEYKVLLLNSLATSPSSFLNQIYNSTWQCDRKYHHYRVNKIKLYSAVRYFKIIDANHEDLELQLIHSISILGFRFLIFYMGGIFIQKHQSKVKNPPFVSDLQKSLRWPTSNDCWTYWVFSIPDDLPLLWPRYHTARFLFFTVDWDISDNFG